MAKPRRKLKKNEKKLIGLLIGVGLVLLAFFHFGLPKSYFSSDFAMLNPTGLSRTYQENFIKEMVPKTQEIQEDYNILPSIIMSQAILESNWGRSQLAQDENNYFGIKDSQGAVYSTQEYFGDWETRNEPFKVYDNFEESMEDHAKLLAYGTSWNPDIYQGVVQANDYQSAAFALQEAGYATDPSYSNKLIRIIETYDLYQYDWVWLEGSY